MKYTSTPGQNLSLNWGISQYLTLAKDQNSCWRLVPLAMPAAASSVSPTSVNFHGFYEFVAQDRFQGQSFGLNIGKKF
jgi:hypothetical protein